MKYALQHQLDRIEAKLDKLLEAREWLESKGYYKNWDADYKKSVQDR